MVSRNYRIWSHSILSSLLLFVCVVLLNAVVSTAAVRVDLTEEGLYTLSDGTRTILSQLRDPVTMDVYWGSTPTDAEPGKRYVAGLLEEMESIAGAKLTVRWVDTEDEDGEAQAEEAGILKHRIPSFEGDKEILSTGYMTLRIESGDMEPTDINTLAYLFTRLEYEIARDLDLRSRVELAGVAMANPDSPMLSQSFGGPRSPPGRFNRLRQQLEAMYESELRVLSSLDAPVPDDIKVLLLLAPWNLSELQVFHIDQFVLRGGRLLLLLDNVNAENAVIPGTEREPRSSGMEDWLNHLGVTAEYGLVGDFGSQNRGEYWFTQEGRGPYPYWPRAPREQLDTTHVVLRDLPSMPFFWPSALRADMALHEEAGRTVKVLAHTSPMGHRRPEIGDVGATLDFPMPVASELEEIPLVLQIEGPFTSMWKGKERPLSEAERVQKERDESEAAAAAAAAAANGEGEGDDGDPPPGPAAAGDPDGDGDDADGDPDGGDDGDKKAPDEGDGGDGDDGDDDDGDDADDDDADDDDAPADSGPPRFDDGEIRIVVLGDAELAADYTIRRNMIGQPVLPNGEGGFVFVVNMIDWLRGSEDLISLRSRDTNPRRLEQIDDSTRKWIKFVNVIAVPLLLLCLGLVVFAVRRSQR